MWAPPPPQATVGSQISGLGRASVPGDHSRMRRLPRTGLNGRSGDPGSVPPTQEANSQTAYCYDPVSPLQRTQSIPP
jgi:hypothetical protein